MKPILTLFLLLNSVSIFCQELFEQKFFNAESLDIFQNNNSIYHFHNHLNKSHLGKINLDEKSNTLYTISSAANKHKLLFYSPDSIAYFTTDIIADDLGAPGFSQFQYINNEDIVDKFFFLEYVQDVTQINDKQYLFLHSFKNKYYIYDSETNEYLEIDLKDAFPSGTLFTKSETEFYSFFHSSIHLLTLDTINFNLKAKKQEEVGSPNAKWIPNSNSIGFIDNAAFYILDVESGKVNKWMEIQHTAIDFHYNNNALYVITNLNEIVKYTKNSQPASVFTNENTNSNVEIKIESLFVENDTLIIGATSTKTNAPLVIKIKEQEEQNIIRPQLEISDALCYLVYEKDNIIKFDCQYFVTNTGEHPIKQFSAFAVPWTSFGHYLHFKHYVKEDSIQSGETVLVEYEGYSKYKFILEQIVIEGADNLRLGKLATTDISIEVSNKNVRTQPSNTIYPNPSSDYFHIKGIKTNAKYSLFDTKGTMIQQGNLNDSRIDIRHLNKGTYLIQIQDGKYRTTLEAVKM